ncbi:MAG: ammonium transporter [Chloroflexota bacterium]|nr:ammonium transporter [Chloroflexota bacterium]
MLLGVLVRRSRLTLVGKILLIVGAMLCVPTVAYAAVEGEAQFVFNTFLFIIFGVLVMWMCAGFTMLESGSVRTKNASMICLKNIGLYSIAGLAYYLIGYNLMYVGVGDLGLGGVIGSFKLLYGPSADDIALVGGQESAVAAVVENGYATMSDWFFQMVFVATAASIVSGALAERVRMWSFFLFTLLLTAIIYPIVGAWTWGGGWLSEMGFQDFAGSTIVHSTGGWAALAGALVVGPRLGKFRRDGSVRPTPPSNILVVTLGVFILWFGWFGFNGGSQLALGSAADAVAISHVLVNTNLAAAAGVMAALIVSRPILGRMDLFAGLNGAIAGLVSITAGPDITEHYWAIIIGAIGAVICTAGIKLLEQIKVDDVVGAIPAHLLAGIWGTLAVCIAAGGDFVVQLVGIVAVGAFVFIVSWVLWWVLGKTLSVRVAPQVERLGQDVGELGIEAYPEFVLMPEEDDEEDEG